MDSLNMRPAIWILIKRTDEIFKLTTDYLYQGGTVNFDFGRITLVFKIMDRYMSFTSVSCI